MVENSKLPIIDARLRRVAIVGAGPAGLLLGLLLAQHDIEVEILEMLDTIDPRPRGAAYGPPAIRHVRCSRSYFRIG